VSAWYELSGSVRLGRCPEVDRIIAELRDIRGEEFEVRVIDIGPDEIELSFRGGSEFTDDGADELDDLLRSLGPHALEPAVLGGEYDGETRLVAVDPTPRSFPGPASIPILGTVR
jgi:hypothetical protein